MLFSQTKRVPVDVEYLTCQQNEGPLPNTCIEWRSCPPVHFYGGPDSCLWEKQPGGRLKACSFSAQSQCQVTEATSLVEVKQITSLRRIPVIVCAIYTFIAFEKEGLQILGSSSASAFISPGKVYYFIYRYCIYEFQNTSCETQEAKDHILDSGSTESAGKRFCLDF